MTPKAPRPFHRWLLSPPHSYAANNNIAIWYEEESPDFLLETLRRHAEIAKIGRARFPGSLTAQKRLWLAYRNYLRQAMSNYAAALSVPNRSGCLLYYYAMLNFAKAELLDSNAAELLDQRIGHGLSFSPTKAKSVRGDTLTVRSGVFPLLYKRRTGHTLPTNTTLPVSRLMANIPEIGQQLHFSEIGRTKCCFAFTLTAVDNSHSWLVMVIARSGSLSSERSTDSLLRRHFDRIRPILEWRDKFGITRRETGFGELQFYESRRKFPHAHDGNPDLVGPNGVMRSIRDILGARTSELGDVVIAPLLYKTKTQCMPPSLARYAVTFYASSLVRYRPEMFDTDLHPEQAYLFDAIARECALPMLVDTVSHLEGVDYLFHAPGTFRV